ncbi:MAG: TIM44-like domain-containing protein [Acidimicrobiales bacterium]
MARATADQVAVGMRGIRNADPTFDDEHFLAQARRLFLRYHRAQAEGDSTDIRPYLDKEIRRNFDAGVSGGVRIAPVSGVRSARIVEAGLDDVVGQYIVVRLVALDDEAEHGVIGEDWRFERADATARWINQTARTECPTCGGPRVRGTEVCQYCGVPLAYGGWIVRRVVTKDASPTTTLSRQASLAIIGGAAVVAVLAVVAVFMVRPTSGGGADDTGTDTGASATSASLVTPVGDAGVPGTAELVLGGPLSGARSAEARSIGGDTDCSSVARFAGFSATALPGSGAAGTITLGVAVPDGKQGPGVYDNAIEPLVTIAYQRTEPDGSTVTQSWDEASTGQATLEIGLDGAMALVFSGYKPEQSSADPLLNAELNGSVRFTCRA